MSATKELAIKMIKELEKVNSNLVDEIKRISKDIDKNDDLIKLVMEVTDLTEDELFDDEDDEFGDCDECDCEDCTQREKEGIYPVALYQNSLGNYYHKIEDRCEYHDCEECLFEDFDTKEEPCNSCCQIMNSSNGNCFFYPKNH